MSVEGQAIFRQTKGRYSYLKLKGRLARWLYRGMTGSSVDAKPKKRRGVSILGSTANVKDPWVCEIRFLNSSRDITSPEPRSKLYHSAAANREKGWARLVDGLIVVEGAAGDALDTYVRDGPGGGGRFRSVNIRVVDRADGQVELDDVPVWSNYMDDHVAAPRRWEEPADEGQVRRILKAAVDNGWRVKAIGSGHSAAEVSRPEEVLVDIWRIQGEMELDCLKRGGTMRRGQTSTSMVRVGAGTKVRVLNHLLWSKGKALSNMGSYDGQSVVGAICTGTHGSSLNFGPMADSVVSLDLSTVVRARNGRPTVAQFRIEPSDGITDPALFQQRYGSGAGKRTLIQDDDTFYSAVVSMGCFGIVTSLTVKVEDAFFLAETKKVRRWQTLRKELLGRRGWLQRSIRDRFYFQVLVNTVNVGKKLDPVCQLTIRRRIDLADRVGIPPLTERGAPIMDSVAAEAGSDLLGATVSTFPRMLSRSVDQTFTREADLPPFVSASFNVLLLGYSSVQARSNEIFVPRRNTVRAVDRILELARENQRKKIYHTAPIGVRFVGESDHYLATTYGRQNCAMEVPMLAGSVARPRRMPEWGLAGPVVRLHKAVAKHTKTNQDTIDEVLDPIESGLYSLGGRPHWGQHNRLTPARAAQLYDKWDTWREVYERFNPVGVFDNQFTDRMGLNVRR